MVIEIKPKYYTCLDPIAAANLADSDSLTCRLDSDLDLQNTAHHLYLIIKHQYINIGSQTYMKPTEL